MKSDWDDAPDYLRSRKKPGPWRMVAILGVGSAITWGVIALLAKPIVTDVGQLNQAARSDSQSWQSSQPAQVTTTPASGSRSSSPSYRETPQPQPTAQIQWSDETLERARESAQRHFSNQNYQPKGSTNTVPAPSQLSTASQSRPQPRQVTRTLKYGNWMWENIHDRSREQGLFEWVEVDGVIDHATVCQNYRKGSLIYRDCRKGAKQTFRKICSRYQPACLAGNTMMP